MGNFINVSILIPTLPLLAASLVLVLLISFNRTINRLTKPVSALIVLSLLGTAVISLFFYFKKIEGELLLSNYFGILEKTNLAMHLNLLTEKIIIFFSIIIAILIGFLFYKLPRKKGYVSLIISIGLISSSILLSILLVDFSAFT